MCVVYAVNMSAATFGHVSGLWCLGGLRGSCYRCEAPPLEIEGRSVDVRDHVGQL